MIGNLSYIFEDIHGQLAGDIDLSRLVSVLAVQVYPDAAQYKSPLRPPLLSSYSLPNICQQ
jgi:hypothetical protein